MYVLLQVRLLDSICHSSRLYLVFELAEQTVLQVRAPTCCALHGMLMARSSCTCELAAATLCRANRGFHLPLSVVLGDSFSRCSSMRAKYHLHA